LYAVIHKKTDDEVFDQADGGDTWEAWNDANVGNYDVAMTDHDGDYYSVDFPTVITTAGVYRVTIFRQAAGAPHADNDASIAQGEIHWSGSAEIDTTTLERLARGDRGGTTWYVSKDSGASANSGRSPDDAKDTIANGLALMSNGDTLVIAAATTAYAENVDLATATLSVKLVGAGRDAVTIAGAAGTDPCIEMYHGCELEHVSVITTTAGKKGVVCGASGPGQLTNIAIRHVKIDAKMDGIFDGSGTLNMWLEDVWMKSDYDGMQVTSNGGRYFIKGCHFETDCSYPTGCNGSALLFNRAQLVIIEDTDIIANKTGAGGHYVAGLNVDAEVLIIRNSRIYVKSTSGTHTGDTYGIFIDNTYSSILFAQHVNIYTSAEGTGGQYDIAMDGANQLMFAEDVHYDSTKLNAYVTSATLIDYGHMIETNQNIVRNEYIETAPLVITELAPEP